MKRPLIPSLALLLLVTANTAAAGGSYGNGYRSTSIFYGSGFSGNYGHGYASGYRGGGHYGRGYSSGIRYGHSGHGYGSNNGWYFLGGALLGSLLTYSYSQSRYGNTYVRNYPATTYYQPAVERRVVYTTPVVQTTRVTEVRPRAQVVRRLHRDLEGRCYESKFNDSGDELRIELPPADCDWG